MPSHLGEGRAWQTLATRLHRGRRALQWFVERKAFDSYIRHGFVPNALPPACTTSRPVARGLAAIRVEDFVQRVAKMSGMTTVIVFQVGIE